MPIVDPGIKVEPGDATYDDGIAKDVFLKDVTGKPYVGQVLPGSSALEPDSLSWPYIGLV